MTVTTPRSAAVTPLVPPAPPVTPPAPAATVTFTIDDIETTVPKGTLVIRAAEQLGIQIPRFCDHPLLAPAGACRQCMVEVWAPRGDQLAKMPKPQASCTLEATPGMVVKTQRTSQEADAAQHGIMEMLLINHPLDCPVCDKGGECPLQNQAMSNGRSTSRFVDVKRTYPKPIKISTQILLDRERCILCQRCTRFSAEIAGDPFIALQMRGARQQIGTFDTGVLGVAGEAPVGEASLDESGRPFASYFSGNTVQICPVGALTSAAYRFRSRPFDLVSTPSVSEHDSQGSEIRVDHRRGVVLRRLSGNDPAVNSEFITDKDRFAFVWQASAGRLTTPLVREGDELVATSWAEAVDAAAAGLRAALAPDDERDPRGVGVLPGGRLTLEDAYGYAKFARVALGTNDVDHRARPHSAEEAAFLGHHVAGRTLDVTFADLDAAPAVLFVGLEPEEEGGILFLRLRQGLLRRGGAVLAVAPFASRGLERLDATLLPAAPGTEAEVLDGIVPGASDEALAAAAAKLAEPGAVVLVGERLAAAPGALSAALRLAARTGAKLAWVPRRAGERGAVEAGTLPTLLPGGRPVADSAARVDLAAAWGVETIPADPGRDLTAILTAAAEGTLPALVVGGLEVADLPDPELARRALDRAFVVSLEVLPSEVTARADVVLPVAPPAEKPGTFVTWEGRPRPFPQALTSTQLSDHRVLDLLADALGTPLGLPSLAAVHDELDQLGGWDGARVAAPDEPAGTPPAVGDGQAVLATWHLLLDAGALQCNEPYLAGTAKRSVARLSAATATAAGVRDGDAVTVSTDAGSVTLPALVTAMPDRVVWLPTNAVDCAVRGTLAADAGAVVRLARADEPTPEDEGVTA
jgi:NADH-quinone oxidoreductase subunit G